MKYANIIQCNFDYIPHCTNKLCTVSQSVSEACARHWAGIPQKDKQNVKSNKILCMQA